MLSYSNDKLSAAGTCRRRRREEHNLVNHDHERCNHGACPTYLMAVVETARGATAAGAKAAAEVARMAPRARVNFMVAVIT